MEMRGWGGKVDGSIELDGDCLAQAVYGATFVMAQGFREDGVSSARGRERFAERVGESLKSTALEELWGRRYQVLF